MQGRTKFSVLPADLIREPDLGLLNLVTVLLLRLAKFLNDLFL
jgi:hypothetical protein